MRSNSDNFEFDGLFGGCLHLGGDKDAAGGVRLENSDKLAFANGVEFAATMWVRLPEKQTGDSVIFANKE